MRVQLNAAGQVELKLETPWRDGNTHVVMLPLKFIQRRIEGGFSEVESVSATAATGRALPTTPTISAPLSRHQC